MNEKGSGAPAAGPPEWTTEAFGVPSFCVGRGSVGTTHVWVAPSWGGIQCMSAGDARALAAVLIEAASFRWPAETRYDRAIERYKKAISDCRHVLSEAVCSPCMIKALMDAESFGSAATAPERRPNET